MAEALIESLQESVLAVLAFDAKHGALIAAQVTPEHFSGVYHEVAVPVLEYRKRFGKPPGAAHLEHLFSKGKVDPSDRKTHLLRRTLVNLSAQAESVNAEYIVSRTQDFVRAQRLKGALLEANDRYLQGGDDAVSEVEGILNNALRFRQTTLDAGTFLREVDKSSIFQEKEDTTVHLGIPEFDRLGIGLSQKRQLLYIGPKNSGKSFACVHVGKQGLLQKHKVVHISLEMSEQEVLDRYFQSFFGIATRDDQFTRTTLELDELGRLISFKSRKARPRLDFGDPAIKKILRSKVKLWGARFGRLVIKAFPSGTLTISQLRGYLDYLELTQKFIPTVLIVDYPDLMAFSTKDYRLALGRAFVDLRGIAGERNLALFTPTQSGRSSIGAKRVNSTDVTEDISKVFTADTVLAYSQTAAEAQRGLARLTIEHARNAPKGTQVVLSQSYATGQYVLGSALLNQSYWEGLEIAAGAGASDEDN